MVELISLYFIALVVGLVVLIGINTSGLGGDNVIREELGIQCLFLVIPIVNIFFTLWMSLILAVSLYERNKGDKENK